MSMFHFRMVSIGRRSLVNPQRRFTCPDHHAGLTVPHELLVDTLPMSVVITTLGKNHPLGPWLVQGWPAEVREPYNIADPALPGQCIYPRP